MTTVTSFSHLILGLAVGLALALAHAWAARQASAAALERGSLARSLLGFPLRVGVPAAALFGLSLLSLWALAGALLSFLLTQRVVLARTAPADS